MIVKIIDFNVKNPKQPTIELLECTSVSYTNEGDEVVLILHDRTGGENFQFRVGLNHTIFFMENGKTIDSIQNFKDK
jgi:hypothetical protein